MVDTTKVVFTKTLDNNNWINTKLAKGELIEEVNKLKKESGKGIIVYGGAGFVSSLIKNNLIDEYHLFINPIAIGKGLKIFEGLTEKRNLRLKNCKAFDCGIVIINYEPG